MLLASTKRNGWCQRDDDTSRSSTIAKPVRVLKSLLEYGKTKIEQQELKSVVQEQLTGLDRALAKVEAKQKNLMATVSTLQQIQSAINQACSGWK